MTDNFSRRRFLGAAAAGAAGALLPLRGVTGRNKDRERPSPGAVRLGVASYSLRQLSRDDAIAAVQALHTPFINVKSFHQPYEGTPDELAAGRRVFESAGLQIVGGGTITLRTDDDVDIRKYFEYAKHSGMPLMVIAPTPETLPRIERFCIEYDIRVAVHNHGPNDIFPGPRDVIKIIGDMDPRVGVCVDVGHTARTGVDVVDAIAEAGARVLDIHMKDLRDLSDAASQCIVGEGAIPIRRMFEQLNTMEYQGYVNLEYEIDAANPLPGMKQSFAYMRGVLAGMEPS